MTEDIIVRFTINGEENTVIADPLTSLQNVLRDQLLLTGTKAGCRQGGCGSCSVLVDDELELSCLIPIAEIEGCAVETIEGMSAGETLHPIQSAFVDNFALQCGFCTPGMVMATRALLAENAEPSQNEIIEALSGNVCRCTGYEPILRAVADAAERLGVESPKLRTERGGRS
jgi:carbon-monoxide dehydrogenase small subunit